MTQPILNKVHGYSNCKYDLINWKVITSLEKEKQGLALLLSLPDQDKQAARNISEQNLSSANGVKLIIEELDELHLKDDSRLAYDAYKKLFSVKRNVNK